MLVVTPLSVGGASYFLDGPAPGRWAGEGRAALGLAGDVEAPALRRVLDGRHPGTGDSLVAIRGRHRRAGSDLTFAAPKSLSLLCALATSGEGTTIARAHEAAVADAMAWAHTHALRCRRNGEERPAAGVWARYDHRTSDGGDPHLHTHVILANLGLGGDGRWSALVSGALWPSHRPLGGVYRLALRWRLQEAGLAFGWRPVTPGRDDGLLDVAAVPQEAITAVSARHREVTAALGQWEDGELASRHVRRAVRAASRSPAPNPAITDRAITDPAITDPAITSRGATRPVPRAGQDDWRARLQALGWGSAEADRACADARRHPARRPPHAGVDPAVVTAAAAWLQARSSSFTIRDAARAVAATHTGGMTPQELDAAVAQLCPQPATTASPGTSPPPRPGRWTTAGAVEDGRRMMAAVGGPAPPSDDRPRPGALQSLYRLPPAHLAEAARLLGATGAVQVVRGRRGQSALLDQAGILAAAAHAWEAEGATIAVLAPPSARRRWEALTGIRSFTGGKEPDVLVVDRAERWAPPDLLGLLERARRSDTRLVLVEGGSLPALHRPATDAFRHLDPGAHRSLRPPPAEWRGGMRPAVVAVAPGGPVTALSPADAVHALAHLWIHAPGQRPRLVGLGPAEVTALNHAVRAERAARGEIEGPALEAWGRQFQRGDAVLAIKDRRLAAGTFGTVVGLDSRAGTMAIAWDGHPDPMPVDRFQARGVGHGYAVTAGRASASAAGREAVLVLGDPRMSGRLASRAAGSALVVRARDRTPTSTLRDRLGAAAIDLDRVVSLAGRPRMELDRMAADLGVAVFAGGSTSPPDASLAKQWDELRHATAWRSAALTRSAELHPDGLRLGRRPEAGIEAASWDVGLAKVAADLDRLAEVPGPGGLSRPDPVRERSHAAGLGIGW